MYFTTIIDKKIKISTLVLSLTFFLVVFQNIWEKYIFFAKAIDELFTMVLVSMCFVLRREHDKVSFSILLGLFSYAFAGLIGNLMYSYQSWRYVLIDFITNMKFWLTLVSVYALSKNCNLMNFKENLYKLSIIASWSLFFVVILDRIKGVIHCGIEYLWSQVINPFGHSTYLVAAEVLLVSLIMLKQKSDRSYLALLINCILIVMTYRSKGYGIVILILGILLIEKKPELKKVIIGIICIMVILAASYKFRFYYVELRGKSARSVLSQTAMKIMRDYFPIGTGFGTYSSHVTIKTYSPVYYKYGFENTIELNPYGSRGLIDDVFWPIVIGQTGAWGILSYISMIYSCFWKLLKKRKNAFYLSGLISLLYLLISSTSETAFNNPMAIPFAVIIGMGLAYTEKFGE